MAMLGVFGEVFVGSLYNQIFHKHLWDWTVLPAHGGYTSLYAPFLWGVYGFQLYLFHDNLARKKVTSDIAIALIFGLETIILEILINLSFRAIFGKYLFYYSPTDLWHFTSVQTFPFFFIASLIYTKTIKYYAYQPYYFSMANAALCYVLVALA